MPKVLFVAAHRPDRSPSQRYRFEQYFSFLEANGFSCHLSYIINEKDDATFYSEGKWINKTRILLKSFLHRIGDTLNYGEFDIVFVQREAIMVGLNVFEKLIKGSGAKFIFDFDDSIWLMDTSSANKKLEWLKNPQKTSRNIKLADLVFAGNEYLANYAKSFNPNVWVVPTTIDTDKFFPLEKNNEGVVNIGWSGSITTIKHFESSLSVLRELKTKYKNKIKFTVMGDPNYNLPELEIKGVAWSSETEPKIINSFDIGIMPLPDDEWAKGKCGLKGLSYMACGVPSVMSPVGVNNEIIQNGINGFLASNHNEWVHCLSLLIESAELRNKLGNAGRKTVIDKYSVLAQRDIYLKAFRELLK